MGADSAGAQKSVQERLALMDQLRHSEIRATRLRVASVVGHLIGTPLNVIVGRASLILSDPAPERVEQNARKIEDQVGKLTHRIRRLIEYLNPPDAAAERRSLGQILRDAQSLYGPVAEQRGVGLQFADRGLSDVIVEDGVTALVLLTALVSMAVRAAVPEAVVEVNVVGDDDPEIEVVIPGMATPRGRIDSMEPPEDPDPVGADQLQTLAVGSALARRMGSDLEVAADGAGGPLRVRFACMRLR
jgi:signal transduction histidine kinase